MRMLVLAMLLFPAVARAELTWGLGLRTSAQALRAEEAEETTSLVGGGFAVRLRIGPRWGAEVSCERLTGTLADGAYEREAYAATLTGSYHFLDGPLDVYALVGFGGTKDEVTYTTAERATATEEFKETHAHIGVGIERVFGPIGLGAELRGIALWRRDHDEAKAGDAVPPASAGVQVNLAVTYYF